MTRPSECRVCGGRQIITLPLRPPSVSLGQAAAVRALGTIETRRDYPCPECSQPINVGRVAILSARTDFRDQMVDAPGFMDHARGHIAEMLAVEILKSGLIQFHPVRDAEGRYPADGFKELRGEIGVVAPAVLQTIEERVAERQFVVADELAAKAAELISIWGSDFRAESISKDQAISSVREALKRLRSERESKTPPKGETN